MTATAHLPSLTGRFPEGYRRHFLHDPGRSYPETNCYADVIIELIHARGLEPVAGFGHLVRIDFEGDQWTFFKPPPEDLERLYGIDIHEMQPYRPLPEQAAEQIARNRTLIVELDSWYLPDTAATSYRSEHVKSSVAIDAIDPDAHGMSYFHGPGLWRMGEEDYRGVFRLDEDDPRVLPPYTELVRFDAGDPLQGDALSAAARELLRSHLRRRPTGNPFATFGHRLVHDLPLLLQGDLAAYHAYAFATVRMAGSAFEVLRDHARWLLGAEADAEVLALEEIVAGCKALSFRIARRRAFETAPRIDALGEAWDRAMLGLTSLVG